MKYGRVDAAGPEGCTPDVSYYTIVKTLHACSCMHTLHTALYARTVLIVSLLCHATLSSYSVCTLYCTLMCELGTDLLTICIHINNIYIYTLTGSFTSSS
jgi:hypothetical protein